MFLQLRVYGMRYFDEHVPYWGNTSEKLISLGDDRLTARSVKIFADGALRSGGAAVRFDSASFAVSNPSVTAVRTIHR